MLKLSTAGRLFAITLNSRINKGPEQAAGSVFPKGKKHRFQEASKTLYLEISFTHIHRT